VTTTAEQPVVEVDEVTTLATRVALLKAIGAEVKRELDTADEEFQAAMAAAKRRGQKAVEVRIPDEYGAGGLAAVATASYCKDGKPTIVVNNMPAAVEWVAERWPEQIQEVVHPTFLKNLLEKRLKVRPGKMVTDEAGEVVDWASVVAGAPGSLRMVFDGHDEGKARLLAAWLAGQLPENVTPRLSLTAGDGG
jgi:hypothetical protein